MSRPRAGFTLIELTIVVVIIAILAAIGVPRYQYTKAKAYSAAEKSDLRNLVTAEESYYSASKVYSSDLALLGVRPSAGVELTVVAADGSGWGATATHPAARPLICAIYFGDNSHRAAPASDEGKMACIEP